MPIKNIVNKEIVIWYVKEIKDNLPYAVTLSAGYISKIYLHK